MKVLAAAFIMALLFSALAGTVDFGTVHASTDVSGNPKPSVPEFTVKLEAHPYYVPPTYSIDQYTGENITYPGYHVENKSVVVTIKNQHFSSSYFVFYNVRHKGHFGEDWTELYSYDSSSYSSGNLLPQSSSEYTVLSIPAVYPFIDGAQVDFQVEAMLWHNIEVWIADHPGIPGTEELGHYETKLAIHATSGWSSTQTLTISEGQSPTPSPAATPTPTPYQEPQQTEQEMMIGAAIAAAVIGVGVGLLIYFIKRK